MSMKRWLSGSCSASPTMCRTAVTKECVPHWVGTRFLASRPRKMLQEQRELGRGGNGAGVVVSACVCT